MSLDGFSFWTFQVCDGVPLLVFWSVFLSGTVLLIRAGTPGISPDYCMFESEPVPTRM